MGAHKKERLMLPEIKEIPHERFIRFENLKYFVKALHEELEKNKGMPVVANRVIKTAIKKQKMGKSNVMVPRNGYYVLNLLIQQGYVREWASQNKDKRIKRTITFSTTNDIYILK